VRLTSPDANGAFGSSSGSTYSRRTTISAIAIAGTATITPSPPASTPIAVCPTSVSAGGSETA
jgi:hypothetical protein